jgi:hypothetical protein
MFQETETEHAVHSILVSGSDEAPAIGGKREVK